MPKIQCQCSHIINLSDIPSKNQSLLISDVDFDKYQGSVDAEVLYKEFKIVVKCNQCGRLHIYWSGMENDPVTYVKES